MATFRHQGKLYELWLDKEYTYVCCLENTTFRYVTVGEWTKEFDEIVWKVRQDLIIRQVMQS